MLTCLAGSCSKAAIGESQNAPETRDSTPHFEGENPALSPELAPSTPLFPPTCIGDMAAPNPTVAGSTSDTGTSPQPNNYPEIEIDVPPLRFVVQARD
jgi:hypothetical protein